MPLISSLQISEIKDPFTRQQVYNGMDTCMTLEIKNALYTLLTPPSQLLYNFERALQLPLFEMMQRGVKIDVKKRDEAVEEIKTEILALQSRLSLLSLILWNRPVNPNSKKQLEEFLYKKLKFSKQYKIEKGERKVSVSRKCLEKLQEYYHARPLIDLILAIRDKAKTLSTLQTEIGPDGRYRTSFNLTTETTRLSSSKNSFGDSGNLQNLTRDTEENPSIIRQIFRADEGYEICSLDFKQSESYDFGWLHGILFDDWEYLDLVQNSDEHTEVARMIWPNLPWTGDIKKDKNLANKTTYYRNFSYRNMSKLGAHACKYLISPSGMARHLRIPEKLAEEFQERYYAKFPTFPKYFKYVAHQLQTMRKLTNAFGVSRVFFGDPSDPATLREAVAYNPQSATANRTNLALCFLRRNSPFSPNDFQLLVQVHDDIKFQFKPELIEEVLPFAQKQLAITLTHPSTDRVLTVPTEAKVGLNFASYHEKLNPGGLKEWQSSMTS
jgi:DNA polymerase I-like protein with 3'-5' exonuclease and polymerase domains